MSFRPAIGALIGKPIRSMHEVLAPEHDARELEKAQLKHHDDNIHLLDVYGGVHEVMVELIKRGYKLGVFTGFDGGTYGRLQRFNLEAYFDSVIESTKYTKHKPDPEGLFMCMQELGVSPAETVYVGDRVTDMLLGKSAVIAKVVGGWLMALTRL